MEMQGKSESVLSATFSTIRWAKFRGSRAKEKPNPSGLRVRKVDGIELRCDLKLCRTYGARVLFSSYTPFRLRVRSALGWANLSSRLWRLDVRRYSHVIDSTCLFQKPQPGPPQ